MGLLHMNVRQDKEGLERLLGALLGMKAGDIRDWRNRFKQGTGGGKSLSAFASQRTMAICFASSITHDSLLSGLPR